MYLMMDREISCKGHCESFSHLLDLVRLIESMKTRKSQASFQII